MWLKIARMYNQEAAKHGREIGILANHVPVLIPCHCVVRSDGSLGGYAGGLERKRKLLEAEGAAPQRALNL
mgnify:CR=1 FL=1